MFRYGLFGLALLTATPTGLMAQRQQLAPVTRPLHIVLPAPAGVTLAGRAPRIVITWQPVAGALDYAVIRTTDAAQPGTLVSAAGLTTASFVDGSSTPGTVYYYTITARFSGGTASATPVRFDPPPTIVKSGLSPRLSTLAAGSTAPAGNGLPAITGVSDTVIGPGGPPVTITGRYLWDVTGVYFGSGTPGSQTNPRFLPGVTDPTGNTVQVSAPPGCWARGTVVLEQDGYPGVDPRYITYITQSGPSQVRLYCAGKPTIQGTPLGGHVGQPLILRGANLSWVNQVTNLVGGGALSFRVVSDNELWVNIPSANSIQYPMGQMLFQPNLVSPQGSTALPTMQFFLPPVVTAVSGPLLSPGQVTPVDPGGTMVITGYGLTGPSGQPNVLIDGLQAIAQASPGPGSIAVTVPAGVSQGNWTVITLGGSVGGQVPVMGMTVLSGVSPATAAVGQRVTVTGRNLFGARGICFTNPLSTPAVMHPDVIQPFVVGLSAPSWQQWTNTSVTVDVPAGAGSGRLGWLVAGGGCMPSGTVLQVQ